MVAKNPLILHETPSYLNFAKSHAAWNRIAIPMNIPQIGFPASIVKKPKANAIAGNTVAVMINFAPMLSPPNQRQSRNQSLILRYADGSIHEPEHILNPLHYKIVKCEFALFCSVSTSCFFISRPLNFANIRY